MGHFMGMSCLLLSILYIMDSLVPLARLNTCFSCVRVQRPLFHSHCRDTEELHSSFGEAKAVFVTTVLTTPSCGESFSVDLPALICGSSPDRGVRVLPTSAWVPASSGPRSRHGSDLQVPPPLTVEKDFQCDVLNSLFLEVCDAKKIM